MPFACSLAARSSYLFFQLRVFLSPCHQVPCPDILASWDGCRSLLTFVGSYSALQKGHKMKCAAGTGWSPLRPLMANTVGLSGQLCVCMAPAHWDLLLGMQASPQRYRVLLHLRAFLDFCSSSARSWSHPPDLMLPLDHSDLCYGDGETEAGRCHDFPYILEDQESRVHALLDLPAMQLVIRSNTPSPRGRTSSWG